MRNGRGPIRLDRLRSPLPIRSHTANCSTSRCACAGVDPKESVTPDFVIGLEDGKKFKSLKRHIRARYNLTPDEYRTKWSLPADYPMPNYSDRRSVLARSIGLGRQATSKSPVAKAPASWKIKAKWGPRAQVTHAITIV